MAEVKRARLDRRTVLLAGVRHADAHGLAALSMRALAADLGVVPMALYKHVTDKDDLLTGMIDVVVAGFDAPPAGLDWPASVRARVLTARAGLTRHPWVRSAIETHPLRGPAVLAWLDAVTGDLMGAGVSVDLAHYAMHALGHRVWGFTPEPVASPAPATPDDLLLMRQAFPHLAAIAIDAATRNPGGACDEQAEFEFTLDLLLAAFVRLHETGWQSRPRPTG